MEDEHRIQHLQVLVESLGWTEGLRPLLADRYMRAMGQALAGRATLSDGELRGLLGDAANAQWLSALPEAMVQEWLDEQTEKVEEEREREKEQERAEYRVEHGMSAPMPQTGDGEEES